MNRLLREGGSWDKRNGSAGLNTTSIWTPSYITTALWLDAADSSTITIATGVSQWNDKSGNGRNTTQPNSTQQPLVVTAELNGKNVIRFDGSNDGLVYDGSFFVNTSYTIYSVLTRRSSSSDNFFMGGSGTSTNQNLVIGWATNTTFRYAQYANDIDVTVAGYTSPITDIWGTWLDTSAGRRIFLNGTSANTNSTTTALSSNNGATIGAFPAINTYYNGDVAEIVATTNVLSTDNRQKLEGYLAWKWGLVASLPNDHPYKSKQPRL